MRLLIDENVHRLIAEGLTEDGHDVLSVAAERPSIGDGDVLDWAVADDRVLITSDRDFGKLLVADTRDAPAGVVYLRLPRMAVDQILERLRGVLSAGSGVRGYLIIVSPVGDRWRSLLS